MPDAGRLPELSTLTSGELERTCRDLTTALALARPGSPAQTPIQTHLAAINTELASRTSLREEVRGLLEDTRHREYLVIQPLAPGCG